MDGTHIFAHAPEEARARYHDREGNLTQNVLVVCSFEMLFTYILGGWEGSASDGYIYERARERDLVIPPGKYYLADAGFPTCNALLVPYRGVQYHLQEWARGSQRYV